MIAAWIRAVIMACLAVFWIYNSFEFAEPLYIWRGLLTAIEGSIFAACAFALRRGRFGAAYVLLAYTAVAYFLVLDTEKWYVDIAGAVWILAAALGVMGAWRLHGLPKSGRRRDPFHS